MGMDADISIMACVRLFSLFLHGLYVTTVHVENLFIAVPLLVVSLQWRWAAFGVTKYKIFHWQGFWVDLRHKSPEEIAVLTAIYVRIKVQCRSVDALQLIHTSIVSQHSRTLNRFSNAIFAKFRISLILINSIKRSTVKCLLWRLRHAAARNIRLLAAPHVAYDITRVAIHWCRASRERLRLIVRPIRHPPSAGLRTIIYGWKQATGGLFHSLSLFLVLGFWSSGFFQL